MLSPSCTKALLDPAHSDFNIRSLMAKCTIEPVSCLSMYWLFIYAYALTHMHSHIEEELSDQELGFLFQHSTPIKSVCFHESGMANKYFKERYRRS